MIRLVVLLLFFSIVFVSWINLVFSIDIVFVCLVLWIVICLFKCLLRIVVMFLEFFGCFFGLFDCFFLNCLVLGGLV